MTWQLQPNMQPSALFLAGIALGNLCLFKVILYGFYHGVHHHVGIFWIFSNHLQSKSKVRGFELKESWWILETVWGTLRFASSVKKVWRCFFWGWERWLGRRHDKDWRILIECGNPRWIWWKFFLQESAIGPRGFDSVFFANSSHHSELAIQRTILRVDHPASHFFRQVFASNEKSVEHQGDQDPGLGV